MLLALAVAAAGFAVWQTVHPPPRPVVVAAPGRVATPEPVDRPQPRVSPRAPPDAAERDAVEPKADTAPATPPVATGDRVVVRRDTALRAEPAADAPTVMRLAAGDVLERLAPAPVLGYYRVRRHGRVGWVWWPDVRAAAAPKPPPAPGRGTAGERR